MYIRCRRTVTNIDDAVTMMNGRHSSTQRVTSRTRRNYENTIDYYIRHRLYIAYSDRLIQGGPETDSQQRVIILCFLNHQFLKVGVVVCFSLF